MTQPARMMIMAGGTGGHVFPALAVAHALISQGTQVTWLGTRKGLEATVIPANEIPIEWISIEGLRGKSKLSLILAPFRLLRALWQSAGAIRRIDPDCVLGMGGFVSGPGGIMSKVLRRPLIIHEQNAVAGLTNKYLAKIADEVLTGFPNVLDLPATARWVGNPVRNEITAAKKDPDVKIRVLIVGGSQGAHSFNAKLPHVIATVNAKNIELWHQSGRGRSEMVRTAYQAVGLEAKVSEFIEDMAAAYRWADVLICRAGAMTIAECCAAGKPALLIPYPFSAGDHQVKNAEAMMDVGAAKIVANENIESADMITMLTDLLSDKQRLVEMGNYAQSLHKPGALNDVVSVCREYLDA